MNRILVALDTSETAGLVLEQAILLAESTGAKLHLLRVVPETVEPPVANIFSPGGDVNALVAEAEADLLKFEMRVPEAHRDGVVVVVGQPFEAICKNARSYNADIVFIGAHQYGMLDRVLGTTAAKIVNHIDRPIFIVRPVAPVVSSSSRSTKTKSGHPVSENATAAASSTATRLDNHAYFEAGALVGATAGVAVGALAGPPGAIAGGVIGTAIGMLAGNTIDREEHRTSLHDHDLDDAIGVTRGDLGARDRASAALTGMQHAERQGMEAVMGNDRMTSLAKMLRAEHQRLEALYSDLLAAYRRGEWEGVRAVWTKFEPALKAHMDLEEKQVFPAFRAAAPAEADALAAEHAHVRKLLDTLGIAIEIHAMPHGDAEELVVRLRQHGQREEHILYPWLEAPHAPDVLGKLGKLSAA